MQYDLAVIGGGAAGLAAAVSASGCGRKVIVLEAGNAIGKKILASGNGRCNLMNSGELRYYGDSTFAKQVLEYCGIQKQKSFWKSIGLITSEDMENRIYPCTYQSATVLLVLKTALKLRNAEIALNTPVTACEKKADGFFVITTEKKTYSARKVLITTGGPAGRKSGCESCGYDILRNFGHTIHPLKPALVPLITDQKSISGLSGIRVKCSITLMGPNHIPIHSEKGELLFTDKGISGICVMQCGRFIEGCGYTIEADFASGLFPDDDALMKELLIRKETFSSMPPETLLIGMINAKIAYAVMKQAGSAMKGELISDLDAGMLSRIIRTIRHYRIEIISTKDMEDAQVTAGGAECSEFMPENLESRLVPGLYAAGEILDTDGDCGGFNLMFAFGSGILAGLNGCIDKLKE